MERLKLDATRFKADNELRQAELELKANQTGVDKLKTQLNYEADLAKIQGSKDMAAAQLAQQAELKGMDIESKEKLMSFEAQIKQAYGTGI